MVDKKIKEILAVCASFIIFIRNLVQKKSSFELKDILKKILYEFLGIWVVLEIFVNFFVKYQLYASLLTALLGAIYLEFEKVLKGIIEIYDGLMSIGYNLKNARRRVTAYIEPLTFRELFNISIEETINEIKKT